MEYNPGYGGPYYEAYWKPILESCDEHAHWELTILNGDSTVN